MDEILLYDGAEPGGVWIDYIELKKVGGGTTEPPVTQPETPTPVSYTHLPPRKNIFLAAAAAC